MKKKNFLISILIINFNNSKLLKRAIKSCLLQNYENIEILVFDEATSALDGNTEADVMKEINNLSLQKTIVIVAHRLSTVKSCEKIYFLSNGELVDSGSYDELLTRNRDFQEMARNS